MALFNSFPATYSPYYPQTYHPVAVPNQNTNQQQANSGIIWVQGESGAKSYLVAPNTTVALWDSEDQKIYLKSADASGMPSIKTIDYTIQDAQSDSKASEEDTHKYISKDELEALQGDIQALRADVDKMKHAKVKLTRISEEEDND